ncbi:MAG: hypothetical protein WAW75_08370 [Gallionella sp.]
MKLHKVLWIGLIVYFLLSIPPTLGFYKNQLFGANSSKSTGNWKENIIPYIPIERSKLMDPAYDQQVTLKMKEIADSLIFKEHEEFANNMSSTINGYELRRFIEPDAIDPERVWMLQYVDFRLNCGCSKELDLFRLLRFELNPNTLEATICVDETRPWKFYVPTKKNLQ